MGKRLSPEERNAREKKRKQEKQERRDAAYAASQARIARGLITRRGWENRDRKCPYTTHDPDLCKGRVALNVPICVCHCHRTLDAIPDTDTGYAAVRVSFKRGAPE